MPASILLTCACESVLLLDSSAWFMPSSFLRLRIKMPIPVDCFIINSSLLFQLSVQPVIVYAKSKFASAENQQVIPIGKSFCIPRRSNPTLAQIKLIQQRIKSFSLIWSLHQSASTYGCLVRCSEETTGLLMSYLQ